MNYINIIVLLDPSTVLTTQKMANGMQLNERLKSEHAHLADLSPCILHTLRDRQLFDKPRKIFTNKVYKHLYGLPPKNWVRHSVCPNLGRLVSYLYLNYTSV